MKQTAVEWLEQELLKPNIVISTIIDKAKAMEREQIGDAYVHGAAYGINIKEGVSPNNYYHEKFKSK